MEGSWGVFGLRACLDLSNFAAVFVKFEPRAIKIAVFFCLGRGEFSIIVPSWAFLLGQNGG